MIIGSVSGWLMLFGMIARPRATSSRTNSGVIVAGSRRRSSAPRAGGAALSGSSRERLVAQLVLADRDELHLGRDDAAARVMHLRDVARRLSRGAAGGAGRSESRRAPGRRAARGRTPTSVRRARPCRRARRSTRRATPAAPGECRCAHRDRCTGPTCRRRRAADSLSAPNDAGVSVCAISRIGTRMSGAGAFDVDLARSGKRCNRGGIDFRVAGEELVVGVHRAPRGRRVRRERWTTHASLRRHYPNRFQGCCLTDLQDRRKDP